MNTARRWYIYLVCAISLQSATWAIIALLRNLLAGGGGTIGFIAFQIAVIVIALPIFLVHWLWAQRLADREAGEREASLRCFYLYGMSAGFLGALVANAFSLAATLLWTVAGKPGSDSLFYSYSSPPQGILDNLIAIIILGLLWFYQQRAISADAKAAPETGASATIHRLYIFVFSAWGLTMTTMAIIHVIRWIMFQFGRGVMIGGDIGTLTDEVARLIVGAPLWILFWRHAQGLYSGPSEDERESALRKFYLYASVFVAVLSAVTNATLILAGFFRRLLGLASQGDIRDPLPIVFGMAFLWAYHAYVLRREGDRAGEAPRQAGIRRLYLYLVSAIGLAAFLVGFSGDISVLIRSFSQYFSDSLREQLAWFTAALIAGLPVWLLPWRQAQLGAVAMTPAGAEERRSAARKNYLYFYLFVATLSVLSSAVYILYRLLSLALGERGDSNLASSLGQAIAYALVGVGVWLYHGSTLRGDGQVNRREQATRLEKIRVALVNFGDERFGKSLLEQLQKEMPGLTPDLISLPVEGESREAAIAKLGEAGLIVGPWPIAVTGGAGGLVSAEIAQAVGSSPARKILIPTHFEGWDWAGVESPNAESALLQTARAVKQFIEGEEIKPQRPMSVGGIIGMIIGVLLLLILLAIPVLVYFSEF
jgi:hypothetical protein